MPSISPESRQAAKAIFAGQEPGRGPCPDCGGIHARACPRIAKIHVILNRDGHVTDRAVEYWPPGTWEETVLFPEDVHDEDKADDGADERGTGS